MKPDRDVVVRTAEKRDIREIHDILARAFTPYCEDYTDEAYGTTVVPVHEIDRRLGDANKVVFVAEFQGKIVGTVAVDILPGSWYIQSMAVRPDVQRKGIGMVLIEEIEKCAREKGVGILSLECYEPLAKAIHLYEKCGFVRTGRSRAYHGITIFEMQKELRSGGHQ